MANNSKKTKTIEFVNYMIEEFLKGKGYSTDEIEAHKDLITQELYKEI
jgi:hypothetical protein